MHRFRQSLLQQLPNSEDGLVDRRGLHAEQGGNLLGRQLEELEQQEGAELPDREAMSLVNANLAIPVNAAVAANVLSDGSTAYANAIQQGDITQGIGGTPPTT